MSKIKAKKKKKEKKLNAKKTGIERTGLDEEPSRMKTRSEKKEIKKSRC